ncbi:MAG: glycosyltransferase family 2 protein [Vicinamibacterales bacterium]
MSLDARGTPVVSVIMPAHNAGRYLRDAVESVLAQRFDAFELLVTDDGSTDDTGSIVEEYARRSTVRVFHNSRNLGAAATRNRMLADARGRYVTPVDADDLLLPGNLTRLSTFLDAHPDVGVVYADVLSLSVATDDELLEPPIVCGADCAKTWDLLENVVNHGGSMSRRDVLLDAGGYDEDVYSVDDWSLWLKVTERTRIQYLPGEIYYLWRRHPESMTRREPRYQENVRRIVTAAATRRGFSAPPPVEPPA